jgi:hypothetical protein
VTLVHTLLLQQFLSNFFPFFVYLLFPSSLILLDKLHNLLILINFFIVFHCSPLIFTYELQCCLLIFCCLFQEGWVIVRLFAIFCSSDSMMIFFVSLFWFFRPVYFSVVDLSFIDWPPLRPLAHELMYVRYLFSQEWGADGGIRYRTLWYCTIAKFGYWTRRVTNRWVTAIYLL